LAPSISPDGGGNEEDICEDYVLLTIKHIALLLDCDTTDDVGD